MKSKWETKTLGEIGNIFSGNSINEKVKKTKYLNIQEGMPYVATKDVSYENDINYKNGVKIPKKDLDKFRIAHKNSVFICAEGGSAGRKLAFNTQDVCFVNKLFAIEPKEIIEPKFVYYFYQSDNFQKQFKSRMTGLIGGVSMGKFKDIEISYPDSLEEQKQIVKILDEVFESISKSKENAEKNLKNAKELFESYLEEIFSNPKEDWEEKKFEKCLEKVKYTTKIQKKDFLKDGKYPIVSQEQDLINGYWNKKEDLFEIKKPVVIFGDHTQILKYIDFDFVLGADGVKILQPVDKIDPLYFYYVMKKIRIQNLGYARHYRLLKEKMVPIPPISEQKAIVQKLDDLSAEIKQLEEIYSQKLKDLEELKKSMLQKAFSGELTKE